MIGWVPEMVIAESAKQRERFHHLPLSVAVGGQPLEIWLDVLFERHRQRGSLIGEILLVALRIELPEL